MEVATEDSGFWVAQQTKSIGQQMGNLQQVEQQPPAEQVEQWPAEPGDFEQEE